MRVIIPPFNLGPRTLYTARSDSTWLFFPFSSAMDTTKINKVKLAYYVWNITGDFQVKAGVCYADQEPDFDWTSATGFGTVRTSNGREWGSFGTLAGSPQRLAVFGLMCANVSASNQLLEMAEGAILLSTRTF